MQCSKNEWKPLFSVAAHGVLQLIGSDMGMRVQFFGKVYKRHVHLCELYVMLMTYAYSLTTNVYPPPKKGRSKYSLLVSGRWMFGSIYAAP